MLLRPSIGLRRHCEERKRRSSPWLRKWRDGLLRFARNDAGDESALIGRNQPPLLGSLDLREIEVIDDGYGRPALALHGTLAQLVGPCNTSLSLSHDGDAAIAVVLFQSGT